MTTHQSHVYQPSVSANPTLQSLLQNPKVRVVTHDCPRNASSARNVALQKARGEWITYLDDDDAYRSTKLEMQFRQAQKSRLPIGTCGTTFHLRSRQRDWLVKGSEIGGSELLLIPLALPTLFHLRTSAVLFDENLNAGEDAYYFYQLLRHFQLDRIFNVPESLVDVYPQAGVRVNTNAEALWEASQAIYRDFASGYGPIAAETFLARAQLGYSKFQPGDFAGMVRVASKLVRLRGRKDLRFILNCFLFKLPLARRFLVH
jgi:hypothetical protein